MSAVEDRLAATLAKHPLYADDDGDVCKCGWEPDYEQIDHGAMPAYELVTMQHSAHVAAALREREETAGHIAESERCRAMEATRELVEAREAIERVRAVIESPYHGTYWGRVQVPQEDLRRAIEGPAT